MQIFKLTLLCLALSFSVYGDSSVITIKPFFQFNDQMEDTYGVEVGWWPYPAIKGSEVFIGYDFGLLANHDAIDLYSDFQVGSRLIGLGSGLYLIGDGDWHTGLQFNAWLNAFAGFNFKYRWNPQDPMGSATAFYIAVPLIMQDKK